MTFFCKIVSTHQAGTKCCSVVAPLRGTECKKETQRGRGERKREEERGRERKREEER